MYLSIRPTAIFMKPINSVRNASETQVPCLRGSSGNLVSKHASKEGYYYFGHNMGIVSSSHEHRTGDPTKVQTSCYCYIVLLLFVIYMLLFA